MGHIAGMTSGRPHPAAWRARLPLLSSLAALLLLAVLATRGGSAVPHGNGLIIHGAPARPVTITPSVVPGQGRLNPVIATGLSSIVLIVILVYLAVLIAMVIAMTRVRIRRARKLSLTAGATDDETEGRYAESAIALLRGAKAAMATLRQRAGGPPSDAVQQAWLVLEAAAAESGTARRPEQTSTEFTGAVLAAHEVDAAALATLRTLYQRARFGDPAAVTETDAERAVDALDRIAVTLTAQAGAAPAVTR